MSYLENLLKHKGYTPEEIEPILKDIRLNYGGVNVYVCKNKKTDPEVIRREVKQSSVTKVAKKYRKSRGFVYNYLK